MLKLKTGLDKLSHSEFSTLCGKKIGILCNQASVNSNLRHILELILPLHRKKKIEIKAIFGPQHGLWGHTQDNMIEWEGKKDREGGIPIHSLYGKHRKPSSEMLKEVELILIDLQDVGSRYYTFIWTMTLCLEACEELGIAVLLLDRPNPIGGKMIEGTLLDPFYSSFVGLYPLTQRHGMTIGEIAKYIKNNFFPKLDLSIIQMENWERDSFWEENNLFWIMPSPNIPIPETTLVYPGMCLLEGTNVSEGRGTTRPFEIFGSPWLDGAALAERLNKQKLEAVYFRSMQFQPTIQKYAGQLCEGCFIHVTNIHEYKPVITTIVILKEILERYPGKFEWKKPPYEYEYEKMPFDILAGNNWLREYIENDVSISEIKEKIRADEEQFSRDRIQFVLYQ
jgi:uncharacterized protein YbbC (DUF1343 family)